MGDRTRAIELYNEGLLKVRKGDLNGGREALQQSMREDPSRSRTYAVLGKVAIQQGDMGKARWYWETALVMDPQNGTAKACLDALTKRQERRSFRVIVLQAVGGTMVVALLAGVVSLHRQIGRLASREEKPAVLSGAVDSAPSLPSRVVASAARPVGVVGPVANVPSRVAESETNVPSGAVDSVADVPSRAVASPARPVILVASDTEPAGGPPVAPQTVEQLPAKRFKRGGERAKQVVTAYARGRGYCSERRYSEAIACFGDVLSGEGALDLKDNAAYWIGECYYATRDYERALDAFLGVSERFPTGNKVPHAKLMAALCRERLGQFEEALNDLRRLREQYPASPDSATVLKIIVRLEKDYPCASTTSRNATRNSSTSP